MMIKIMLNIFITQLEKLVKLSSSCKGKNEKKYISCRNILFSNDLATYCNCLNQMFLKLIGSLLSPCDCSFIGAGPCLRYDGIPM